jgi:hypothetical protein
MVTSRVTCPGRLILTLKSPTAEQGTELALLLLCMRLITQIPSGDLRSAQNTLYLTAKTFFTVVESNALMECNWSSRCCCLARIEVEHGIYPAAFLSAGHCARLVYALGLHDRKGAPLNDQGAGSWAEREDFGRVWWIHCCWIGEHHSRCLRVSTWDSLSEDAPLLFPHLTCIFAKSPPAACSQEPVTQKPDAMLRSGSQETWTLSKYQDTARP